MSATQGPLVILSGPSGAGKSTVLRRLLGTDALHLHLSVSATTRAPRGQERHGVDYHFWTRQRFDAAVRAGALLEWAEVWGKCYGTLRSEVEPYRERGDGVVLDIDVQGAAQVRRKCPEAVTVFLRTSSLDEYERRLRMRHTEDEPSIQRRLAGARAELAHAGEYDHQVINDDLEAAVADLYAIVAAQFRPETKEK
jgi:guanylate kinase